MDLEDEVIAELELDTYNTSSVRKLALQIAWEVDRELHAFERDFGDDRPDHFSDNDSTSGATSSGSDDSYDGDSGSNSSSENGSSW